jgi:putative endonuclease
VVNVVAMATKRTSSRSSPRDIRGDDVRKVPGGDVHTDEPKVLAHNQSLGAIGEDAVLAWYEQKGYRLIARNWRSGRLGELDLVFAGGTVARPLLVFCEVKTRSSARFGSALEAITPEKARRLRLLGMAFRSEFAVASTVRDRFDVAAITGDDFTVVFDAL